MGCFKEGVSSTQEVGENAGKTCTVQHCIDSTYNVRTYVLQLVVGLEGYANAGSAVCQRDLRMLVYSNMSLNIITS